MHVCARACMRAWRISEPFTAARSAHIAAHVVMACVVMAHIAMAEPFTAARSAHIAACVVMACVVMALCSYWPSRLLPHIAAVSGTQKKRARKISSGMMMRVSMMGNQVVTTAATRYLAVTT